MAVIRIGVLAAMGVILAAGAVSAQGMGQLSGTLSADYDRYDFQGHSANQWNASGSAVLTLDNPGGNIQVNFDNAGLKTAGVNDQDKWDFGGDAYWRDYAGEFGVNISQNNLVTGSGRDYLTGGFFGEFYMLSDVTLRAKGGRVQGDFEGWYGDTGAVFYPLDQVAISVTGDYARFKDTGPRVTDGQISIEYLPVPDVPISLSIGYTYAHYSHLAVGFDGNTNIFSVALKAYFGGGGRNGGLVDYQRNGATNWDGPPATIVGASF
jgi:hypothetical protein